MKCQRDPSCVRDDDHADLCVRIDGSVILKRRTPAEVGADFTYARDCMQRSKAIRSLALAAQDAGDSGYALDENTSPRHAVPHPHRHPEAEAQIAAAHQPPDAFETAMQTGVDDALEEHARREHAKQATDPSPVFAVDEPRPQEPSIVLTGNDLDTFESFSRCAAALEEHAEQGQALQVAYRNALQAVSAMAARRNRGK